VIKASSNSACYDLQTRKHALEARLSKPLPTREIGELGPELKAVDAELASHEEKWRAISKEIEASDD